MSSSPRSRGDRRWPPRAQAALLAVALLAAGGWLGLTGVARADLGVVAVPAPAGGGPARMIAELRPAPATPLPATAFTVTAGAATLPVGVTPLLSGRSALGLVVDASAAGAAALPAGLSGVADLLLQLPAAARVSAVADTAPPRLLASLAPGPAAALRALDDLRPAGARQTAAALDLAAVQLPADPAGPRLLVLYTGAADAGGEPAATLAARLARSGAVLAVVCTAAGAPYWSQVAGVTGGAAVSTEPARALDAFGTLARTLRARYRLTVPLPAPAPGAVTVTVRTGGAEFSTRVPLGAGLAGPPPPAATPPRGHGWLRWVLVGAVVLLVGGNAALLLARTRARAGRAAGSAGIPVRAAPPGEAGGPPAAAAPDQPPPGLPGAAPATGQPAVQPPGLPGAAPATGQPAVPPAVPPVVPPAVPPVVPPVVPLVAAGRPGPPTPAVVAGTDGEPAAGYAEVDAALAEAAAAVESGELDRAHAIARIALAAPGRTDLIDRLAASEHRIAGSRLARWPPTATVLDLLLSARLVTSGEVVLAGPGGVRVEHATPAGGDPSTRVVLRLTRRGQWVCDCRTAAELAAHVDLSALAARLPG